MSEKQELRIRVADSEAENWVLKKLIITIQTHHCKLHDAITERAEKAETEIKRLKLALSKCSPFSRRGLCEFCILGNWEHTDDCEYVLLTGG